MLKPINKKIIVTVEEEAEKKTESGIILTGTAAKESFIYAIVESSASDQVVAGNKVVIYRNSGLPFLGNLLITENDILAIVAE